MVNLLFDYDGTIHETIKIYSKAFRKAVKYLDNKGLMDYREYSDKEISKWLGFTAKEMWNTFAPNLDVSEKDFASKLIGDEMFNLTKNGYATLYKNSIYTLETLKSKGYNLIFLSNCKTRYMNIHRDFFKLDRFFTDLYSSEEFNFIPKYEIFNKIKDRYKGEFIIVGDRIFDIEIAEKNGLRSIGCKYGYGDEKELSKATYIVDDIMDILKYF